MYMKLHALVSKFGNKRIFNSLYSRLLKEKPTKEVQELSISFSVFLDKLRTSNSNSVRSSIIFKDGDFLFCRGNCEPLDLFISNNDWTDINSSYITDDSPIANDIALFSDLLWQIFIKV